MRGRHDDEIPEGPQAAWIDALPWVLRARALLLALGAALMFTAFGAADTVVRVLLFVPLLAAFLALFTFAWYVLEHSALGMARAPRLRWIAAGPLQQAGLPLYLGLCGGLLLIGPASSGLTGAATAPLIAGLLGALASPWLLLAALSGETSRGLSAADALDLAAVLGARVLVIAVLFGVLFAAGAFLAGPADAGSVGTGVLQWGLWALAWLAAQRLAGRLVAADSMAVGISTDEDLEIDAAATAERRRIDALFVKLHGRHEVGDVAGAVADLEAFLAPDGHVLETRLLYELAAWRWPRLHAELGRAIVGRHLAAGNARSAWALLQELADTHPDILPLSHDDMVALAAAAAGPGERRRLLVMARVMERAGTVDPEDPRLALVWLAIAEVALEEGDTSRARVLLARAETRFPHAFDVPARGARRDALRRALAVSASSVSPGRGP
ncbi:MAG TPA: hypothetical protein VLA56_22530 [Pseudomonadales bacterium]|nr:hypothetical protein [Pseudomonadales bacterium]